MSLDFTALDFETANRNRGSACSIGLVKVRDGVPVDFAYWLIRPSGAWDFFDYYNSLIHGITAETVADAPPWEAVLPLVTDYVGGDLVVAHNARFDLHVMRAACYLAGLPSPSLTYLCSLVIAKRTLDLPSYRLPFVAEALGVDLENHHHAAADALAAADTLVAMARRRDIDDLESLAVAAGVRIGRMDAADFTACAPLRSNHGLIRPEVNTEADPEHPFYGRVIVFTGALVTMTRQEAWETVASRGALPEPGVTKRTNILVAADVDPRRLVPGSMLTQKAAKAFALQAKGQDIEILTEDDLLRAM